MQGSHNFTKVPHSLHQYSYLPAKQTKRLAFSSYVYEGGHLITY